MRSQRRVISLMIAILATCVIMVAATLLAQASHASESGRWTTPRDVSQSGNTYSIAPDLVVDTQEDVHLIWMTGTTSSASKDLYYAKSTDSGSTWSAKHHINTVDDSSDGSLAVGSDGTAHITWWEKEGTVFKLYYASGVGAAWGPPTQILQTGGDIWEPRIAVANGIVHIVFSYKPDQPGQHDWDLYYTRKDTTWSLPPTIVTDTASDFSRHARIVADPDGNLHLTWHDEDGGLDDIVYYISGTVSPISTIWSRTIKVSNGITEATAPNIAVGSDKTVHIAFGSKIRRDVQYVYYVNFPMGSPPDPISATLVPGSEVDVSQFIPYYPSPSLALRGDTEVHLVWNGAMSGDISDRVYYAISADQGASWSEPIPLSGDDAWADGFGAIAVDATKVHVAWQQKVSINDHDIYYTRHFPVARFVPLGFKNYP